MSKNKPYKCDPQIEAAVKKMNDQLIPFHKAINDAMVLPTKSKKSK